MTLDKLEAGEKIEVNEYTDDLNADHLVKLFFSLLLELDLKAYAKKDIYGNLNFEIWRAKK